MLVYLENFNNQLLRFIVDGKEVGGSNLGFVYKVPDKGDLLLLRDEMYQVKRLIYDFSNIDRSIICYLERMPSSVEEAYHYQTNNQRNILCQENQRS